MLVLWLVEPTLREIPLTVSVADSLQFITNSFDQQFILHYNVAESLNRICVPKELKKISKINFWTENQLMKQRGTGKNKRALWKTKGAGKNKRVQRPSVLGWWEHWFSHHLCWLSVHEHLQMIFWQGAKYLFHFPKVFTRNQCKIPGENNIISRAYKSYILVHSYVYTCRKHTRTCTVPGGPQECWLHSDQGSQMLLWCWTLLLVLHCELFGLFLSPPQSWSQQKQSLVKPQSGGSLQPVTLNRNTINMKNIYHVFTLYLCKIHSHFFLKFHLKKSASVLYTETFTSFHMK